MEQTSSTLSQDGCMEKSSALMGMFAGVEVSLVRGKARAELFVEILGGWMAWVAGKRWCCVPSANRGGTRLLQG